MISFANSALILKNPVIDCQPKLVPIIHDNFKALFSFKSRRNGNVKLRLT